MRNMEMFWHNFRLARKRRPFVTADEWAEFKAMVRAGPFAWPIIALLRAKEARAEE